MRAIAKVEGLISWPNSFSGATFGGSFFDPLPFTPNLLDQPQVGLDEQPRRAAVGVIDALAGLGIEDNRHEQRHLRRRQELAGAAALAFGKLAQEIFVGLAEDVLLHVLQPEPVLVEDLDERGEAVVVEHPLAGGRGVEVGDVYDALEARVDAGDGADGVGEVFAHALGLLGDLGPAGFLRDEEADELVVGIGELEGLLPGAELGFHVADFVLEHVRDALEEDERQDVVLELGRIHRPANHTRGFPEPGFESRKIKFHKGVPGQKCRKAWTICIVESVEGSECRVDGVPMSAPPDFEATSGADQRPANACQRSYNRVTLAFAASKSVISPYASSRLKWLVSGLSGLV